MNLLIATEPDDAHAILTQLALEHQGHDCTLWYTADMPSRQTNSIYINNDGTEWVSESRVNDNFSQLKNNPFDVVWWRRARFPYIPNTVHEEDRQYTRRENIAFFDSFSSTIATNAWWINPPDAQRRANSKAYQLKIASQCKFKIPMTLMSNSPAHIKEFTKKHQDIGVIYKSFLPNYWKKEKGLKVVYTARVNEDQFPEDGVLQLLPGIFQVEIKKKYELRITCFGGEIVAVKVDSQKHEKGNVDWRMIPNMELTIEPYKLDENSLAKIRNLMEGLGIIFGCFDFIVSTDDELYFLEVNEQGQFLWIEEINPEIKMVDMFTQFLTNDKPAFQYKKRSEPLSASQFTHQTKIIQQEKIKNHVYLNGIT